LSVFSTRVKNSSFQGQPQRRSALLFVLQATAAKDQELAFKQTLIGKLTHENGSSGA
jgi:hypothetical protein